MSKFTVEELAALVLTQQRGRLARDASQWQADAETVAIRPGRKYTKIDRGPESNMSGFLMIDNITGEIFGIKGYGVVHKGHRYGTLETADQWYWGEHSPRDLVTADATEWPAGKTFGELTPAQRQAAARRASDQLQAELTTWCAIEVAACWPGGLAAGGQRAAARSETSPAMARWVWS
ncbi:MAG: hypothetical protein ACRDRJ_00720 [Streptosporangiaceae bacterium]